jgi:hypothetical protein
MQADLIFTHPQVRNGGPLVITTGADSIKWSYSLNTVSYPTYGGEVVQILSVAINDVNVMGTCRSYAQMEDIYSYFLEFVQIVTQGRGSDPTAGVSSYNQQPMTMQYVNRDWTFKIVPRALPEFRKGREVVAPEWRMSAYMVDDSYDLQELQDLVRMGYSLHGEEFELTGGIGYTAANPFSDPFTDGKGGQEHFDPDKTRAAWEDVGDYYNKIIPSWLQGDFDSLTQNFSASPAFLNWGHPSESDKSADEQRRREDRQRDR